MGTITTALTNLSTNGLIRTSEALKIGAKADEKLSEAKLLLNHLKTQVGMTDGERIERMLADMDGTRFDEKAYHHERLPEGQE